MERPYSRLSDSFSIAQDLFKITFFSKGYDQKSFVKKVLDPELWCLIIIALLITTGANAQNGEGTKDCGDLIVQCATDITVECGDMLDPLYTGQPIINKDDNCPLVVQVGWQDYTLGNCPKVVTRTWSVTDENGKTETCIQTITVLDTMAPVFTTYPQDMTVECGQVPLPEEIDAIDNCKKNLIVDFEEVMIAGNCETNYTLVRTWSTVDDCQNTASMTQTIWVIDTVAPTIIGVPADVTVNCNTIPEPDPDVSAEDNCKSGQTVYPSDVILPGNCPNNYVIERTWWAEDGCGNVGWATQIITVVDDQAPILSDMPQDITVECDNIPDAPVLMAMDDCKDDIPVIHTENIVAGNCANAYTIERTWTATDECGNTTAHTQLVNVEDNTAPQITINGNIDDIVLLCSEQLPEPPLATASDNCDEDVTVVMIDNIIPGSCAGEWTVERVWTATDDCGNSSSMNQTISVVDTVAPVFTVYPMDMTVTCEQVPAPAQVEATDNCKDDLVINFEEETIAGNCESEYTLVRTWTTVDDCQNMASVSQTIWVIDTVAPTIYGVPADITVTCSSVPDADTDVSAEDNCKNWQTVYPSDVIIPGDCETSYTIERTWWAEDGCGNISSATQIITVIDTTAPVIYGVPADVTVSCNDIPEPDTDVSAEDDCKSWQSVYPADVIIPGDCETSYTIERTWWAEDGCGNIGSATQIITVIDTTAPVVIGVPADITVNCNSIPEPDPDVSAEDNCKSWQTVYPADVIIPGNCPNNYVIERTWWAEDGCGNTGWATQIITVVDDQAPVLTDMPQNVTVECDNIPVIPEIFASDDCKDDIPVIYTENIVAGICANAYIIERTWTATDECGNATSHTQLVSVEDNTAPQLYLVGDSDDKVILCSEQMPAAPTAMAVDNCDENVTVVMTDSTIAGSCANEWTIHRSWTATDACGNSTTLTQTIQVIDTVAPQFTYIPADMTLACGEQIPFEDAEAMDNCDSNPSMMYEDDMVQGSCAGEYTLFRTWIVTDDCGNSSMAVQTIYVIDTVGPVFDDVIVDITVVCGSMPPVPECTATDACEGFVPAFFDGETIIPGNCPGNYSVVRSWTAVDDCGNSTTQTQTITVIDTLAPMLTQIPVDITVQCDDIPDPALVEATDSCDPNVSLNFEETRVDGDCEGDFTLIRIWTATDACGNSSFAEQWITVIDTVAPQLDGVPQNVTVECDNVPDPAVVTAWDACKAYIPVYFSEDIQQGNCKYNYEIVRTWVADDGCGNSSIAKQIITVIDTVAPVFNCMLQDVTVDCNNIPDPEPCKAIDNCDEFPVETFTEVWSASGCSGVYTITRTYTATDDCGNMATLVQVITVDNGPNINTGIGDLDQSGIQLTAFPNPFNEETMIRFILPSSGNALLEVFDMRGRVVEVLYNGQVSANTPVAREFRPQEHNSGSYIYRLSTGDQVLHGRLVLTR